MADKAKTAEDETVDDKNKYTGMPGTAGQTPDSMVAAKTRMLGDKESADAAAALKERDEKAKEDAAKKTETKTTTKTSKTETKSATEPKSAY